MSLPPPTEVSQGSSTRAYVIGLALAVGLTLMSYVLATRHALRPGPLVALLVGLALLQFVAQVLAFLHPGEDHRPRWKLYALLSMVSMIVIFVAGALWIMNNLNTRMTMDQQIDYMNRQGRP